MEHQRIVKQQMKRKYQYKCIKCGHEFDIGETYFRMRKKVFCEEHYKELWVETESEPTDEEVDNFWKKYS